MLYKKANRPGEVEAAVELALEKNISTSDGYFIF
jgi:hypothetical protein